MSSLLVVVSTLICFLLGFKHEPLWECSVASIGFFVWWLLQKHYISQVWVKVAQKAYARAILQVISQVALSILLGFFYYGLAYFVGNFFRK